MRIQIKVIHSLICLISVIPTVLSPVTSVYAVSTNDSHLAVIYFFYAHACSYCEEARQFLQQLQKDYSEIIIRDYEVYLDSENREFYKKMIDTMGLPPRGMPTIIIGEKSWVGFQHHYQDEIKAEAEACLNNGCIDIGQEIGLVLMDDDSYLHQSIDPKIAGWTSTDPISIDFPLVGNIELASFPLFISTIIISFVDGFNPCSLWVLSVLLSIALYTKSQLKTIFIGTVFIFISGLVYALFISGIFTILTYINYLKIIRLLISLTALFFGLINIKDYFFFKEGFSLTIPDEQKPGIFQKMRSIISSNNSVVQMFFGVSALAIGVSLIELSCTAGLPIIWTNLISLHNVGAMTYVFLLAVYMIIYMIDEMAIFLSVVISMRAIKLKEKQGRFLKLISGILMVFLAGMMLIKPSLMNDLSSVMGIFLFTFLSAFLINFLTQKFFPSRS